MAKATIRLEVTGSSRIKSIEYDPISKELVINYVKGGSYKYFEVPQKEFDEFHNSESVGVHCTLFLGRGYKYEKIVK